MMSTISAVRAGYEARLNELKQMQARLAVLSKELGIAPQPGARVKPRATSRVAKPSAKRAAVTVVRNTAGVAKAAVKPVAVRTEAKQPKTPRPATNRRTLATAVSEVFAKQQSDQGLTLAQIADLVQVAGWETKSKNFENTLYQTMRKQPDTVRYDRTTKLYYRV